MTRQDAVAGVAAYDFAPFARVVDVGAGHGALVSAIRTASPRTTAVLFDQPAVVAGAEARLRADHAGGR